MGGEERVRVLSVRAKNIKSVVEAYIDMNGDYHEIRGDAGQGKTSLLDAIEGAVRGIAPSMVRRGEDRAELELRLTTATILRYVHSDATKDDLSVTSKDGIQLKAKAFCETIWNIPMFRPMEWVRLSGGEKDGSTKRRREQRDMLLRALSLQITHVEVVEAVRALGVEHVAAFGEVGFDGIKFDQQSAIGVCAEILDRVKAHRKERNKDLHYAEQKLEHTKPPEWAAPEEDAATCETALGAAQEAFYSARAGQRQREGLTEHVQKVQAQVASAEQELAHPRERLEKEYPVALGQFTALDDEVKQLEQKLEDLRSQRNAAAETASKYEAAMALYKAQDERRAHLAKLESELEEGGIVANLGPLEEAAALAEKNLDSRRQQDLHDQAATELAVHKDYDKLLEELRGLFWDVLPNRLLAAADLPLEGLSVSDTDVLVNGIPVHQLGGSQQIRVAVVVASVLNKQNGFVLVDAGESLGRSDRLALKSVAAELGLQLIITFVDEDAVPGPGVTVMANGRALE